MVARTYATEADYLTFTGEESAPSNIDILLSRAARMLDAKVFRHCSYDVDATGAPTHDLVVAAFRDAVCAQVSWWDEVGDSSGAAGVGWTTLEIGSARLSRPADVVAPSMSAARQVAPAVWDVLASPDLTPDILRVGAVTTL